MNTPFIIFTGKGREEVAAKALNLGADQYLNKNGDAETVYVELAHSIQYSVDRREKEEKVRESEEKFRKIFESAKDCIVFLDNRGRILDVNGTAVEMFGGSKDELLGKNFTKLGVLHISDIPKLLKAFTEGLAGNQVTLTIQIKNRKGQEILLEASASRATMNDEVVTIVVARDITERMKAEETLRNSEGKYRTLVEYSLQGLLVVQDFHIVFANKAFADISGYTIEELQLLSPEKVKALIHPEDQALVWGRFLDRLSGKSVPPRYEYRGVRKDGSICWLEMFATRVVYNGKPAIQGMIIDVTDRKKAEQTVRADQESFEAAIKYIPEAAVYLDCDFRIQAVNSRFSELFLYTSTEVIGKHINDVVVPKDKIEEAEKLDKDAFKGYASHNTVRRRKDGTLVQVSISAAPAISQEELLGYIGIYKDITETRRMEEELEESRRHFQTLFNLIVDPIAIIDQRGKILEVTQRVEELVGYKREELVGKNFLRTKIASAKTKAVMMEKLAKRMVGIQISPYEVEIIAKDGEKLPYEINAAKINYKGKPADLIVFRGISERKKLEEKLRVVGSLTRHDVRNKLTTVTGNTYLLRKKLSNNHDALEHLEQIEAAIRQVTEIFDFARTYENLGVEQLNYVNAAKMVNEAISLFSDLKDVRIVNDFAGLTVLADSLLRQVFYNLIDNSLKYGQKVKHIKAYCRMAGTDRLELIYEDDGVGIPNEIRKNLFKEGVGKGTGYGLFMIKRICDVYGWTIQETGKRGNGVKFIITMPSKNKNGRLLYKLP